MEEVVIKNVLNLEIKVMLPSTQITLVISLLICFFSFFSYLTNCKTLCAEDSTTQKNPQYFTC